MPWGILHYKISREKFEPEPGFEFFSWDLLMQNFPRYKLWDLVSINNLIWIIFFPLSDNCGQNSFKLVWQCHQLLSEFLAWGNLPRVSCQLLLSANDKGDNEMIPEAVLRPPVIYLIAEENPGKSQLGLLRWRLCDQSSPQMS